jgi:uncharacterized protein YjiK
LSCQWKSWLQDLETIKILRDFKYIVQIDEKTHSIKISQLADDTILFCTSKEEIHLAFNEIETFGSFSGLLINKNKTGGIWVGKLKVI